MTQQIKYIHNHTQQLYSNIIPSTISVNIWGRGTGKTWGVTARKAYYNSVIMPRSVGAIGCPSFTHMMEHIYGELVKSWEDMGLVDGKDFVCFQKPPENWKKPFRKIAKNQYSRCIFFRNGSVIKLFSYNYNSLSNGDSIDWLIVDEARLCKKNKIDESIKCLRGNEEHFGHLSTHGSVVYVTDMPRNPQEFWLLEFRKQEKAEIVQEVMNYAFIVSELQLAELKAVTASKKERYQKDIELLNKEINRLCMNLTTVTFASSLDNIHALGPNKLKQWKNNSTTYDWRVAVLNEIQQQVTNGFYPCLEEGVHGYFTPRPRDYLNIDYKSKRDCRWDGDIDPTQPLIIGMDYNAKISCLCVYQLQNYTVKLMKTFNVLHPFTRKDVVQDFIDYYKTMPNLKVVYCFDNTAIGQDADKRLKDTFAYKTITELNAERSAIQSIKLSQTEHKVRYDLWQGVLRGEHPEMPNVRFAYNIDNAQKWQYAASQTKTEIKVSRGVTTFGKYKGDELKNTIPAEELPHITESADTGLLGVIAYYSLNGAKKIDYEAISI